MIATRPGKRQGKQQGRGSNRGEASFSVDPENRLLWRANRRRLTAEQIRDTMLVVSGQLDLEPGESPVAELGTLVTQNNASETGYKHEEKVRRKGGAKKSEEKVSEEKVSGLFSSRRKGVRTLFVGG